MTDLFPKLHLHGFLLDCVMTFFESLVNWLKIWPQLNGRLGRLEYVSTQCLNFWLMVGLLMVFDTLNWDDSPVGMLVMLTVGTCLFVLTVAKRCTDMGQPFSYLANSLIPILCLYYWLELLWRPGVQDADADETLPTERFSRPWQAFHISIIVISVGVPVGWLLSH